MLLQKEITAWKLQSHLLLSSVVWHSYLLKGRKGTEGESNSLRPQFLPGGVCYFFCVIYFVLNLLFLSHTLLYFHLIATCWNTLYFQK